MIRITNPWFRCVGLTRWDTVHRLVLISVLLICVITAGHTLRAYQGRSSTILVIRQGVPEEITRPITRLFGGRIIYVPASKVSLSITSSVHATTVQLPADVSIAVLPPNAGPRIDGAETVTRYLLTQQRRWDRTVTRTAAVFLVLIGMLLALLMQRELSTLTVLFPLILTVLNGLPRVGCISCSGYDGAVVQFMTYGIIAVTVLMAMRYWFAPHHHMLHTVSRWIGCAVPLVQALALALVPMLCYKCLISGFLIYASALFERPRQLVVLPAAVRWVLFACLCVLLLPARPTANQAAGQDIVPLYAGSRWSEHFNTEFPQKPVCVVVVNDGCPPCHRAMRELPATGLTYRTVRIKTLGRQSNVFDAHGKLAPTPLFLVYDRTGICRFVHSGWPIPGPTLNMIVTMLE